MEEGEKKEEDKGHKGQRRREGGMGCDSSPG